MRERWLQDLWACQNWNGWPLCTTQGQRIHVLDPGTWNQDQGPDFLDAKIFIGQVLWVGSVEIHLQTSDWFRHNHVGDPHYLPVILHVVWMQVPAKPDMPTLELSRYLTVPQLKLLLTQLGHVGELSCHHHIRPVPTSIWKPWRMELLRHRFQRKWIDQEIDENGCRSRLVRQMGAWVNREVFVSIDATLSTELIQAFRDDADALSALYLGQSGFLAANSGDQHLDQLFSLYQQFRVRFGLNPPYRSLLWMRIRPAANPFVRMKQVAKLVHKGWHELEKWKGRPFQEIQTHLQAEGMSEALIESLLINLWAGVNSSDGDEWAERLLMWRFEDNRFTRKYLPLELENPVAADSQAMLELNQQLCQSTRCGACRLAQYWRYDQAPQSI